MSKRRKKKIQAKEAVYNVPNISEDKLVEIQAEAYYRALKRMEEDKVKEENEADLSRNSSHKWYDKVLLLLNVLIFPWKISKRFKINDRIYDSVLVIVVSTILRVIGSLAWILGLIMLVYSVVQKVQGSIQIGVMFTAMALGLLFLFIGGMLILSASQFEKEEDSNRIYAYSGSIIALISCIVGVIALLT